MTTATLVHPEAGPHSQTSPFVSRVNPPEPFTLVLFGATGDLAGRKLLPALSGLLQNKYLPEEFAIVGVGRRDKTDQAFREDAKKDLAEFRKGEPADAAAGLPDQVFYQRSDFTTAEGMRESPSGCAILKESGNSPAIACFTWRPTRSSSAALSKAWPARDIIAARRIGPGRAWSLKSRSATTSPSAVALDRELLRFLRPDQIYRIDHYLGKETVQNLLAFRFGNAIFEPLFNRQHVDHVQITVAETVGMEGRRGAFYDHAGACATWCKTTCCSSWPWWRWTRRRRSRPATSATPSSKCCATSSPLRGADVARRVVRGQYGAGTVDGQPARGYREEEAVATRFEPPKPTSPCARRSKVGAGPACRSCCARANGCRGASRKLRSSSSCRRCGCSAPWNARATSAT